MDVKIYKCFVASPSDTSKERQAVDNVLEDINNTIGDLLNFRVESIKWENNARPSVSTDSQAVINSQLLDNYQIFIGIMWNRFGTSTPRAGSGTEEEFNQAYQRHKTKEDIEIMLYFNDQPQAASSLDLKQVEKIREFQQKVRGLGALTSTYNGVDQFTSQLKQHLNDYFVSCLGEKSENPEMVTASQDIQEQILQRSVSLILKKRFDDALSFFSNQPIFWVEPLLSKTNNLSRNAAENYDNCIDKKVILEDKNSYFIKSPPQFGLTSLANHLVKEAWELGEYWVYLDATLVRASNIIKLIQKDASSLNLEGRKIDRIVLDSWKSTDAGAKKLLRALCNEYQDTSIIVMQTIDDSKFSEEDREERLSKPFECLHLLALPRQQIRKFISAYNSERHIGDDNIVLDKVLGDIDALNIHRTPSNFLTLLKVSEKQFDENPVNRTKMIEMVLFALFDLGDIERQLTCPVGDNYVGRLI